MPDQEDVREAKINEANARAKHWTELANLWTALTSLANKAGKAIDKELQRGD